MAVLGRFLVQGFFVLVAGVSLSAAQTLPAPAAAQPEMARIDASPLVRLAGNLRPEVSSAIDIGEVEGSVALEHILLQLRRPADRDAALDAWLGGVTDKASPNYHQWLTPEEFGERFGLPEQDVNRITGWLAGHELTVNAVYPSRMLIDFSATAAQVREVFHTEMHAYEADGIRHMANASDPAIPSALAPFIVGIVSLHDFRPHSLMVSRPSPKFTDGTGVWATYPVTPADLATIYNLTPLFKAGYTGKGQTIAVMEDSDVHSAADWTTFRTAFGLSAYTTGAFKQIHPAPAKGANNCADPGAKPGWDEEPILDAEYASASAPGATIEVAACADTKATNGVLLALANLINGTGALPSVLSLSYGDCEAANGAAANAAISSAYQQAAAEGISVFAAAGDGGAAFCDVGASVATHGVGVNAYASTPYNVAVGGTDFSDTFSGTLSEYWNPSNTFSGGSARSYIPETPWDDSCANPLIAAWNGFSTTYGLYGFCTFDYLTMDAYQTTIAGSGGPSGCASGAPLSSFTVSGTCHGYAKPAWQSVTGNGKDGVRDLPDIALFAADGIWGHYFLFCDSNAEDEDGEPCAAGDPGDWSAGGGTSFAAPIAAGIQALIAQKWGKQGNPDAIYYKLAAAQFTSSTLKTGCNASLGSASNASCIFHDVSLGASTVNCQGAAACYESVLSTSLAAYAPAFGAAPGWDFGTGLGSVNAYNLVMSTAW